MAPKMLCKCFRIFKLTFVIKPRTHIEKWQKKMDLYVQLKRDNKPAVLRERAWREKDTNQIQSDHCLAFREKGWQPPFHRLGLLWKLKSTSYCTTIRTFHLLPKISPNFMSLPNPEKLRHTLGENSSLPQTKSVCGQNDFLNMSQCILYTLITFLFLVYKTWFHLFTYLIHCSWNGQCFGNISDIVLMV